PAEQPRSACARGAARGGGAPADPRGSKGARVGDRRAGAGRLGSPEIQARRLAPARLLLGRSHQVAPSPGQIFQFGCTRLRLRLVCEAHEAGVWPGALQVRVLCLVLDQLAPVEHQGHVLVGHLHEARHVVLAGERDRPVLHPLGHAFVSAQDCLAHALHRRLALWLLVLEPAIDLSVLLHCSSCWRTSSQQAGCGRDRSRPPRTYWICLPDGETTYQGPPKPLMPWPVTSPAFLSVMK